MTSEYEFELVELALTWLVRRDFLIRGVNWVKSLVTRLAMLSVRCENRATQAVLGPFGMSNPNVDPIRFIPPSTGAEAAASPKPELHQRSRVHRRLRRDGPRPCQNDDELLPALPLEDDP